MKVWITGSNGQLGWELQRTAPSNLTVVATDVDAIDITSRQHIDAWMVKHEPAVIINAAAYTAVDKAEDQAESATAVNRDGVAQLAQGAQGNGTRLIHVSTDFIFDGKQHRPYQPDDRPNPLGVYGASKWAGEQAVREVLGDTALIIRTAWVYSAHGHNFVKTILRLARERDELGIVADQVGTPTWANGLAKAIWRFVERPELTGTYHWTDAGVASWYDFAVAIQEEAQALGLIDRTIPIRPLQTHEYPTPAKRPAYGVLEKSATWHALGIEYPVQWRAALREMLRGLKTL